MPEVKRDENGRWAKGTSPPNPGGRPRRERADTYYNILITTLTNARWEAIVEKAVQQAEKGDRYARKFLADYSIGSPEQRLALTGADGGPLAVEYVNDWRVGMVGDDAD